QRFNVSLRIYAINSSLLSECNITGGLHVIEKLNKQAAASLAFLDL
ncbi:18356_t:CDS:1, partial [Racocetra persica]